MTTPNINTILRNNLRNCQHGAPMGAREIFNEQFPTLYVQHLTFTDGCYAADGTYWGSPADVWCGFNMDGNRVYVRADSRSEAIENIRQSHPNAKFHKFA